MTEGPIVETLFGIFASVIVAMVTYFFHRVTTRLDRMEERQNNFDVRLERVAVIVAMAHKTEVFTRNSPLRLDRDEDVERAVIRYIREGNNNEKSED